ncbi:MAG: methyltransferase domain-containing protein [Myxococcales bacterium]|nr:methyltransferase domain-containing protein [Myxococcales bacterium]
MSSWRVGREQWVAWIDGDGRALAAVATGPIDELDAQLLGRLGRHPFPSGDEETISRPALDEVGSFDSRTTMVKGELDLVDEEDQTRVRMEAPSAPILVAVEPAPPRLEVALENPGRGLEVALESSDLDAPTVITEAPPEVVEHTVIADAPPELVEHTVIAEAPAPVPVEGASLPIDIDDEEEDEDDGLYIPALTRTVISPVPTPASDEAPPDEMPAISGETVIGPPPSPMPADGPPPASGFIMSEPDEAARTLVRGEIPSRGEEPDYGGEPRVPSSKVVIDPSASGVLAAVYDEEEDEGVDEEPDEIDADDLVEEADDEMLVEAGRPPTPPPAPPALEVGPPPPPVTAASLHSTLAAIPAAPPVDEGWQVDAFGEHYAALLPVQRAASAATDVEFVLRCTGVGPGASLLDVGCGDGAHAATFAARGLRVTGLDASPVQLMRASQNAQAMGVGVELVSGDMRQPALEGAFDVVVCLGGTVGLFGDADDRQALQQMRDRLVPGGRLVVQVLNRDYISNRLPARSWWQGQGCLVLDEAQLYAPTSSVHVHRTVVFETGKQYEHNMALRVYSLTELVHMCAHVGLRVLEFSGSRHTRGRFYGATSSEIWMLAQRVD